MTNPLSGSPTNPQRAGTCRLATRLAAARLMFMLVLIGGFVSNAQGQQSHISKENRKVISRVTPDYPATLRRVGIGGTVRLHATVLANGTVSKVEIIGGNPILAESGARAVMQWKYAPGPSQTTSDIDLEFRPTSQSGYPSN